MNVFYVENNVRTEVTPTMIRPARSVTPSQVKVDVRRGDSQKQSFGDCIPDIIKLHLQFPPTQNPYIVQVERYLFLGSLEAAYCEPLLCRSRIETLVDVSALHPNEVERHRKSSCPCSCSLTVAHCRAKLAVIIDSDDDSEVLSYFDEINKFIHHHRLQKKNVLVFSNDGLNRAPTVISQYLIQMEHETLPKALKHLKSVRPSINLSQNFMKILITLNEHQTPCKDTHHLNHRMAWSEQGLNCDSSMKKNRIGKRPKEEVNDSYNVIRKPVNAWI